MACAINLRSSVIISGGDPALTTVSEYNEAGWVKNYPDLQEGRRLHGCSYYDNDEGTKVGIDINYYSTMIIFQTYLVSGGRDTNSHDLSSTELLVEGFSAWVYTGSLPSPRAHIHGATIDNRVLMTGKY